MKKSIVAAGVSAVALAAMPVVGVFADTTQPDGTIYGSPIVDNFSITLSEVCTLSRQSTEHTTPSIQGDPINGDDPVAAISGTWNPTGTDSDTFAATIVPGSAYAGIATSAYNVTCNSATGGYQVNVAATGFTKTSGSGDTWNYVAETDFSGNDESQWFLTSDARELSGEPVAISASGDYVWQTAAGTAVTTDDFEITYSIMPKTTQQVGTYTASATYTLVNL